MNQHCAYVCVCIEISAAVNMAENTPRHPPPLPAGPLWCACERSIFTQHVSDGAFGVCVHVYSLCFEAPDQSFSASDCNL